MKKFNNLFMKVALLYSEYSTCAKIKVGAVITKDNRIISTGYNGVPSKKIHCEKYFKDYFKKNINNSSFEEWIKTEDFLKLHSDFSSNNENHAESNAILFAKQDLHDCNIYITFSPCTYCAKLIHLAGIKKVFYLKKYNNEGINYLVSNNVEVINLGE